MSEGDVLFLMGLFCLLVSLNLIGFILIYNRISAKYPLPKGDSYLEQVLGPTIPLWQVQNAPHPQNKFEPALAKSKLYVSIPDERKEWLVLQMHCNTCDHIAMMVGEYKSYGCTCPDCGVSSPDFYWG